MRNIATVLLLTPLLFGACSGDTVTQIVLAISTDIPLSRMNRIRLEAFSGDTATSFSELGWDLTDQEPAPNAPGAVNARVRLPAYLGVLPGEAGSISRPVRFVLQAFKIDAADPNKDSFVLERQAKLTFARDRTLLLRMALIGHCIGVKCGEDESCGEQGCEDIEKKSETLPNYTPEGSKEQPELGAGPRDGAPFPPPDLKEQIPDGGPAPDGPTPPMPDGPTLDAGPAKDQGSADLPLMPDFGPYDQGQEDMPPMPDFGPYDQGQEDMPPMPDFGPYDQGQEDMPPMPDFGPDQGQQDIPLMLDFGPYDQVTDDGSWPADILPQDQGVDDGFGPISDTGQTVTLDGL